MAGKRIGLYSGTFDPITNGHIDIIARALKIVDHVVVAIGVNSSKTPLLSFEDRAALIQSQCAPLAKKAGGKVSVISFSGLVVDVAREQKACCIIRGLRGSVDYEYEAQMVGMNGIMNPEVETVFFAASPQTQFISSTLVRQIASMGGDISPFVPKAVEKKMLARLKASAKS